MAFHALKGISAPSGISLFPVILLAFHHLWLFLPLLLCISSENDCFHPGWCTRT